MLGAVDAFSLASQMWKIKIFLKFPVDSSGGFFIRVLKAPQTSFEKFLSDRNPNSNIFRPITQSCPEPSLNRLSLLPFSTLSCTRLLYYTFTTILTASYLPAKLPASCVRAKTTQQFSEKREVVVTPIRRGVAIHLVLGWSRN